MWPTSNDQRGSSRVLFLKLLLVRTMLLKSSNERLSRRNSQEYVN